MAYIDTLTDEQVALNARRVKAEYESKKQEYDFLAANLANRLGVGTHRFESGAVNVSEVNEYPQAEAVKALSPGQARKCMTLKWDAAKFAALYPAVREAVKNTKGLKVTLR